MEPKKPASSAFAATSGLLILLLIIPFLIFAAIPNMFFGYKSSGTSEVIHMTELAMALGGAYINLEDFEKTQIDSVITGIVSEYERNGTTIDAIDVGSSFDNDDLCWLIAINSAAHQQNLNIMSAADVLLFCTARLTFAPSLSSITDADGAVKTTLKVDVKKLEPEKLMDQLGFDDDSRIWAGALYEVLSESNALEKYKGEFEAYRPDYSGDTPSPPSGGGGGSSILPGGGGNNAIDISGFVSPDTKNNLDLAAYAIQAWENGWGYVWGTYGNVLTSSLFNYKLQQYPQGVGNYASFIRENWLNRRTADCVGLIKGYGWLDTGDLEIHYGTNGMPDYGANQMYSSATVRGTMDTMPDTPGVAVWKSGHIGVYIGGGYVIEAMGTKYGVVKTELAGRGWSGWCKIPYIDYIGE